MGEIINRVMAKDPAARVLILLNNVKLIEQTAERLRDQCSPTPVSVYCSGLNERVQAMRGVTVASVASLVRAQTLAEYRLQIIDEVHNLPHGDEGGYRKLLAQAPETMIIGFTGTPFRATGPIYGKGQLFTRICFERGLLALIEDGYLVRPSLKHTAEQFDTSQLRIKLGEYDRKDVERLTEDDDKVTRQVEDALPKLTDRKSVIWACAAIRHCELVASKIPGARVIHSKMRMEDRDSVMDAFKRGELRDLVFVSVIKEGIDIARIDAVVLMRPIRSAQLMVQICGRALRTHPGKDSGAVILDYGRVFQNLGTLDKPRIPQPGKPGTSRKKEDEQFQTGMSFCEKCFEYLAADILTCPVCGHKEERVATKNLTLRSDKTSNVLSDQAVTETRSPVTAVSLHEYTSRNGNQCLRVDYRLGVFTVISEYFAWGKQQSERRWHNRAHDLGVTVSYDLAQQVRAAVTRPPAYASHSVVDGFPKITRLWSGDRERDHA